MKEKYLLIPCLLFLAAGAFAQQKWDLQQCIAHAQAHNIQLKQQEQVVKNQEISLSSARNSRLPGVDASASQSFNFGRGLTIENTYVNRNTLSTSFSANASMSLYDGGQITRNIQVQKLQLEANMADLTRAQEATLKGCAPRTECLQADKNGCLSLALTLAPWEIAFLAQIN